MVVVGVWVKVLVKVSGLRCHDAYDALPTDDHWDTNIPVDGAIKEGMTFHSKEDCLHAIKSFHIEQSRDYDVIHSDLSRYVIQCTLETC